ncbi:hypothetical protein CI102_455 [Trichoderma harzianum]|nr:hypothetical protein CI102_455 [Trichoderma harzianum]
MAECRKSEPLFFKRSSLAQIDTAHRVCMATLLLITSSVAVASDLFFCGVIKPVLESFTGLGCNPSNHYGTAGFRVCPSSGDSNRGNGIFMLSMVALCTGPASTATSGIGFCHSTSK